MKSLYLDYVALVIYALMFTALFFRTRRSSSRRSVYLVLLVVAVLANIYDVFAVILDNTGRGTVFLKYTMHIGYLILRNLITPIFGAYVISVTDTWHKLYKKNIIQYLIWIPFSLVALLTLTSPINHLVFYIDDLGNYTRGPAFVILYISAIFYTGFCVYYSVKYIKLLKSEKFIPLISLAPLQIVAVVVQLIFPNILCEMFSTSLCLLLVLITIEKPEEKVDLATGLYKSNAFFDMVDQASKVDKPYCTVLINITNHSALTSYLSITNMDIIYSSMSRRLEAVKTHLNINPDIYNLENGLFAAVLYNDEMAYDARYAQHVLDTLKHDYVINGLTISVLTNVCIIRVPEDTSDIDEFRLLMKDFRNYKYHGDLVLASSVMKNNNYTVMANIDSILAKAIENESFEVYYQPIYSNVDKRFNSAEALIRLFTPEYGFIRPDIFIPMAEESGAIHKIGMIVLEKVCKFIASDAFSILGLDYIEVNLSVVQCMDKRIVDKIVRMCGRYGVKPSQINLEVTETASAFAQKIMIDNINRLHELGFSFSLDDFGTGYSNMVRIASLPLHIVKLDKSFTWTKGNHDLEVILENTINMVKKMDMKIVVEGVETEEMLENFTNLGCEYIQGYYFSKPLPEYDFVYFILNAKAPVS